jgi:hypothetical protein
MTPERIDPGSCELAFIFDPPPLGGILRNQSTATPKSDDLLSEVLGIAEGLGYPLKVTSVAGIFPSAAASLTTVHSLGARSEPEEVLRRTQLASVVLYRMIR